MNDQQNQPIQPDISQESQPNIQPKMPWQKFGLPVWAIVLIAVLSVVVVGGVSYAAYQYFIPEPVACALDAKICPDGSSVGRIPPDCEFAPCPEVTDPTADWRVYRNGEYGFEFGYSEDWKIEIPIKSTLPHHRTKYQSGSEPILLSLTKDVIYDADKHRMYQKEYIDKQEIEFIIHTTKKPDELFNKTMGQEQCLYWCTFGVIEKVNIDGEQATRCLRPTGPATVECVWLEKDGKGWAFMTAGLYLEEEFKEVRDQILSTFKFTD